MDFQILRPGDPIFQEWLTARGHRGCERQFLGGTLQDLTKRWFACQPVWAEIGR